MSTSLTEIVYSAEQGSISTESLPIRYDTVTIQGGVIIGKAIPCLLVVFDEVTCRTGCTSVAVSVNMSGACGGTAYQSVFNHPSHLHLLDKIQANARLVA
jgi:hypothetical protein